MLPNQAGLPERSGRQAEGPFASALGAALDKHPSSAATPTRSSWARETRAPKAEEEKKKNQDCSAGPGSGMVLTPAASSASANGSGSLVGPGKSGNESPVPGQPVAVAALNAAVAGSAASLEETGDAESFLQLGMVSSTQAAESIANQGLSSPTGSSEQMDAQADGLPPFPDGDASGVGVALESTANDDGHPAGAIPGSPANSAGIADTPAAGSSEIGLKPGQLMPQSLEAGPATAASAAPDVTIRGSKISPARKPDRQTSASANQSEGNTLQQGMRASGDKMPRPDSDGFAPASGGDPHDALKADSGLTTNAAATAGGPSLPTGDRGSDRVDAASAPGQVEDLQAAKSNFRVPEKIEAAASVDVVPITTGLQAVHQESSISGTTANAGPPLLMAGNHLANEPGAPAAKAPPSSAAADSKLPPAMAGTVNVSRILESIGRSEMHIGLQTLAFGNVEVHTVVRDSQVGLAVGSEKGDLRALLASEMPALQTTLRQQDLHLEHVRFLGQGAGLDAGSFGGSDSQSRSFRQGNSSAGSARFSGDRAEDAAGVEIAGLQITGLSVHA